MTLKLKSNVYRYTGIFLAQKEQDSYMANVGKEKVARMMLGGAEENGFSEKDVTGIVIGSWQCEKGFARQLSGLFSFEDPAWLYAPLASIHIFFLTLLEDFGL